MSGLIVHEWISPQGGSENVVDAMLATFPESRIRCLWNDAPTRYPAGVVSESWLGRTPLRKSKAASIPFMPSAWKNLSFDQEFEWMLVSSHLFAHHATLAKQDPAMSKYVYVHTPARYIWTPHLDLRGQGLLPRLVSPALRRLDKRRASRNPNVAANSKFVGQRILDTWGVDSRVIYPPVDVARIQSTRSWAGKLRGKEAEIFSSLPSDFLLGASRFVPYKRLDLVIKIAEHAGIPAVLAGGGPQESYLRSLAETAKIPVVFINSPSDEMLFALYEAAAALIFPAVEDFGIMPVEAMAAGTPVVVNRIGGASESVLDGVTGAHFDTDDLTSAVVAVQKAVSVEYDDCRRRAGDFSMGTFQANLRSWMGQ